MGKEKKKKNIITSNLWKQAGLFRVQLSKDCIREARKKGLSPMWAS